MTDVSVGTHMTKFAERVNELRTALNALECALRPDGQAGSTYWPARKWLNDRDIFNDDLNEEAVLHEIAKLALERGPSREDLEAL